jgi:hypothetical protein
MKMLNLLPTNLVDSYDIINSLDLVTQQIINKKNINDFITAINNSIPDKCTTDYTIYLFNRKKYRVNRSRFLKDIHKTPYQAMILWTSYRDILEFYELTDRVFLKWNKDTEMYEGDIFNVYRSYTSSRINNDFDDENESTETHHVKEEKKDPPTEDLNKKIADKMMDDQDRLYEYMKKRREAVKEEQQENEQKTDSPTVVEVDVVSNLV